MGHLSWLSVADASLDAVHSNDPATDDLVDITEPTFALA
jgi:hypothetical protein